MGHWEAGCTAAAHCAGLPVCQARWQSAMDGSAERSHACSRAGSGDTHGPARAVGPQSAPQLAERAAARHLARRQLPQQHAERPARPAERVGALLAAVTRAGCSPSGGPRCCNRALPIQSARPQLAAAGYVTAAYLGLSPRYVGQGRQYAHSPGQRGHDAAPEAEHAQGGARAACAPDVGLLVTLEAGEQLRRSVGERACRGAAPLGASVCDDTAGVRSSGRAHACGSTPGMAPVHRASGALTDGPAPEQAGA